MKFHILELTTVSVVIKMFFEVIFTQKNIPKRDSDPQPSYGRWDALTIELLGLRWLNVGCISM